jgi:acyl carrier protein
VPDRALVAVTVRTALLSEWPGRFTPDQLEESVSLGSEGLGLDSIEIVEVLFACEEACGREVDEGLLSGPVTIGDLVDHLAAA